MNRLLWFLFILFATGIGLYPLAYLFTDMSGGLLSTKPTDLLADPLWRVMFHLHILPGGVAMLAGWSQFVKRLRNRNRQVHRWLGRVYVTAVLLSGLAGLYIAFFATGGVVSMTGFGALAILWLATTARAYQLIRAGRSAEHQQWMIRSYALCFAAVTLRVWLPLLDFGIGLDYFTAYRTVAWLCWVPNLIVAEIIVRSIDEKPRQPALT